MRDHIGGHSDNSSCGDCCGSLKGFTGINKKARFTEATVEGLSFFFLPRVKTHSLLHVDISYKVQQTSKIPQFCRPMFMGNVVR